MLHESRISSNRLFVSSHLRFSSFRLRLRATDGQVGGQAFFEGNKHSNKRTNEKTRFLIPHTNLTAILPPAMPTKTADRPWGRKHVLLFLGFVTILAFLTYFYRYWDPPHVYWDENYHIASAQKYLHGVYFMEQHPPLGKLLIALGEKMFHPNAKTDQFISTDYGNNFPEGFSFVGYRFFSALLGWWTAPLLFLIFYLLTKNPLTATLLDFLYIFDNALVVHLRGAMLEGPLMFFCALTILAFLLLLQRKNAKRWIFALLCVFFGVSLGLVLTTKVLGLIMVLLVPVALWQLWPQGNRILAFLGIAGISFLIVYVTIWQIHFSLGKTINPQLPDNGYYQASDQYKAILRQGASSSLVSFPVMLRDSLAFVSHYNAGAPRLDLCKEDENGSPWYFWPLGARTISYRWETNDSGKTYRYLYLVPNPVVWWASFAAVLLAAGLLTGSVFFPLKKPLRHPALLLTFLGMYVCYMIAVSRIARVLYLYHYFIPLLFSFIILALIYDEIHFIGKKIFTENAKTIVLMVFAACVFLAFQFYRPLTYYEAINDAQFGLRNIFSLWELHCVNCAHPSGLVIPVKPPQ